MKLFESRRFWLLCLDSAISILLHYFGGTDVNFLIVTLQPIFIAVITAYTVENSISLKG